jgi:probable lipoprotein NlpC
VPIARPLAAAALLLAACAGVQRRGTDTLAAVDLEARLAARAASLEGTTGAFEVGGARFNADCSGFVEAVYEAEGVPFRRLAALAAPGVRSGVAAAYRVMQRFGTVLRGDDVWPAPGDLVFFHDTYDRNRNGAADDPLTHVGVVEWTEDGTVVFIHRGGRTVAKGAMTRDRPGVGSDRGRLLNSPLREKRRAQAGDVERRSEDVLADGLFAAYGRLDPEKLPPGVALGPPLPVAAARAAP